MRNLVDPGLRTPQTTGAAADRVPMDPSIVVSAIRLPDDGWAVAITTNASPDLPAGESLTIQVAKRTRPHRGDEESFRVTVVDEVLKAALSIGAGVYLGPGLQPPLDAGVLLASDPPDGVQLLARMPHVDLAERARRSG